MRLWNASVVEVETEIEATIFSIKILFKSLLYGLWEKVHWDMASVDICENNNPT